MSSNSVTICCLIIAILIAEVIAYWKRRNLFGPMSQLIVGLGMPTLAGYVCFNFGYMIGAVDQYLAIPGVHLSNVADANGPLRSAIAYCLIVLVVVTLVLRLVDQRQRRV